MAKLGKCAPAADVERAHADEAPGDALAEELPDVGPAEARSDSAEAPPSEAPGDVGGAPGE